MSEVVRGYAPEPLAVGGMGATAPMIQNVSESRVRIYHVHSGLADLIRLSYDATKITAIKLVRQCTTLELTEALALVEALAHPNAVHCRHGVTAALIYPGGPDYVIVELRDGRQAPR